jgi:hypothetical protein
MMSILDRKFNLIDGADELQILFASNDESEQAVLALTREWVVVARRKMIKNWRKNRPNLSPFARFLAIEDLVCIYGGKPKFKDRVSGLLSMIDYCEAWSLDL